MFRHRLNELRLTLRLEPLGPVLVKLGEDAARDFPQPPDGEEPQDRAFDDLYRQAKEEIKQRAEQERRERDRRKQRLAEETGDPEALRRKLDLDMRFVTTRRNGEDEPYLPGSSLKGVLRTRCEQLARTFLPDHQRVCDIFDEEHPEERKRSCTKTVEGLPPAERYAAACRICQVFGCGPLAGRLAVSDGYLLPDPAPAYGVRSGVGINRLRGAAHSGALFFYEVLERGTFEVTFTLENFELWQVGLVGLALHDLYTGTLPVGFGTRRGLGRLQGEVTVAELTYFGSQAHAQDSGCRLKGVASLAAERDGEERYGFLPEPAAAAVVLPQATLHKAGLRQRWTLPAAAQTALWETGVAAWQQLTTPANEEVP